MLNIQRKVLEHSVESLKQIDLHKIYIALEAVTSPQEMDIDPEYRDRILATYDRLACAGIKKPVDDTISWITSILSDKDI